MAKTASDIMEAHDPHLHEAIEDAYYLLAYFSRTRVEIPPDKRSQFDESVTILSSARAIGSRLFQPPIGSAPGGAGEAPAAHTQATAGSDPVDGVHATPAEKDSIAAFWKAFIQLSDLAYPATIESIRYYFRYYNFHFSGRRSQKPGQRDNIKRGVVTFYLNQLSFTFLTIIALSMTIGLSLLSYIGTKSLVAYDDDYTNWSQVQTLSQYLDEAAKVNLKDTIKDTILEITPNTAHSRTIPTQKDGPQEVLSISDPRTKSDPAPDIKFVVPKARAERLNAILAAAAADQRAIAVDFSFACRPIITMFAEAQHVPLPADNQPVNPGGLTVDECKSHVLNAVPPRVIAVADDLASTYSNIKKERETLHRILEIILTPIRLFDVLVVSPSEWAYDALLDILSGRSGPVKSDPGDPPDFVPTTAQAFNLFVLQQQRHSPIPTILPIPSAKAVGTIFDARLAVAITNTYLLTLSFGFLGACVWALRDINLRLESFTLAPSRFPRYRARILLGMVAGPTIGLFFVDGHLLSFTTTSTDAPQFSTQLSAAAIAFIAGFSIEILIAMLDRFIRIIQEFAGANSSHPPTAR